MKKFKIVFKWETYEIQFGYDNERTPEITTATLFCCDKKILFTSAVKRYYKDVQSIKLAQKYATEKVVKAYFKDNTVALNTFTNALLNWQF